MTTPKIHVYTKDPSGMGWGDYTPVHPNGLKVNIDHSMLQGDQMTFQTVTNINDDDLSMKRPVRFYTGDDTKLFDGVITDIEYELIGNDYKKLTGTASGWWQELKGMDLVHDVIFENETPNDMFAVLTQMANDFGLMKKAQYIYDTDKIPYYSIFDTAYNTATDAEFVIGNVFQGMQDIVSYLDVAELYSPYDFALRIESLPAASGESWVLSESNVDTGIYITPYVMREDANSKTSYGKFQLEAGFDIRKDYRDICNSCIAIGDAYHTQQLRTTHILNSVPITSNDDLFPRDNQVLGNHYLAITIDNITGSAQNGWIQITRVEGTTNPVETFPMTVPAGETATYYTSERTGDGLPGVGQFLRCVDFNGSSVMVREVTNDNSPYQTTVGGRSINEIGYAAKRIENMWITTQAQADALAGKMVRLYHNPTYLADANILTQYISFDNNLGKVVDIYSQFDEEELPFILLNSRWEFNGDNVSQSISGVMHATHWDNTDRFDYIIDSLGNDIISSTGAFIVV